MPTSVPDIEQLRQVLIIYKTQLQTIITKHKDRMKKAVEEIDRRQTQKLLKRLGK